MIIRILLFTLSLLLSAWVSWCSCDEKVPRCYSFVACDVAMGKVLCQAGDCGKQESPCSTFKIPLALMGFDVGILKNEHEPAWSYAGTESLGFDVWRQPHNPTTWIKNSCIWYSQKITESIGFDRFKRYVETFAYGNQDISGNPGKNDGLSGSWLCSSLKISPRQQVEFLRKLLRFELPVSQQAVEMTKRLLFVENLPGGWKLYGKTGAGVLDDAHKSIGWFVGWVTKEQRIVVFACLMTGCRDKAMASGVLAKAMVIKICCHGPL